MEYLCSGNYSSHVNSIKQMTPERAPWFLSWTQQKKTKEREEKKRKNINHLTVGGFCGKCRCKTTKIL